MRIGRLLGTVAAVVVIAAALWIATAPKTRAGIEASPLTDAEIQSCAACHPRACEHFQETPHARTLSRATGEELSKRFAGHEGRAGAADGSVPGFAFVSEEGRLWAQSDQPPLKIAIDWIFGSGTHAQTPVSVRDAPGEPQQCLEYHVTWYPEVGLALTLGHQDKIGPGVQAIGDIQSPEVTHLCFGCHTTGMQTAADGRIDFASFESGVRCDRCHPGARAHLLSGGDADMEAWSKLSAVESVTRCGECHRTVQDLPGGKADANDSKLIRFAPVGLMQSPCFVNQGALRLDCLTCHDPHRPTPSNHAHYVAACVKCHAGESKPCSAQPLDSNCLPCHMPELTLERHIRFTDHWIRIREPGTAQAESGPPANTSSEP